MAKKKGTSRKPGGAAGIATVEDLSDEKDTAIEDVARDLEVADIESSNGHSDHGHPPSSGRKAAKPKKQSEPQSSGNFGAADIRKAASFANSIGGLDKAIALLQLLKIAKEVQ